MTAPEDHPDRVVTPVLVDDGGGVRGGLEERFEMIAGSDRYDAGLEQRFELVAECGNGDGLVHGDFHPGNVRAEAFAFFDRPWFARTRSARVATVAQMPRLLSLTVSDAPGTWAGLGFTLDAIAVRIGSTAILCSGRDTLGGSPAGRGITDWMLSADDGPLPERLDGLLTGSVTLGDARAVAPPAAPRHVNGVEAIDHLVVMTPDVDRTVSALEDLGIECRRRREAAAYGRTAMRQAFFWLGNPDGAPHERVILEVVGPEIIDPAKANDPAKFFGIALTCRDLDETAAFFGDLMKPPVEAVQSGRRIATLSSRAGSQVAIALMSPHVS